MNLVINTLKKEGNIHIEVKEKKYVTTIFLRKRTEYEKEKGYPTYWITSEILNLDCNKFNTLLNAWGDLRKMKKYIKDYVSKQLVEKEITKITDIKYIFN